MDTPESGCLLPDQYEAFWERVAETKGEANTLINELSKAVVALYLGGKNIKNVPVESVFNTLSYAVLFLPMDKNPQLRKSLEMLQKAEANGDLDHHPGTRDVLRLFSLKLDHIEADETPDLLGPVAIGASTLHTAAEFGKLPDILGFPSFDPYSNTQGVSCFYYYYLRKLSLRSQEDRERVLGAISSKLLTVPQQMKMNAQVAETTLTALLHMFVQVLSLAPAVSSECLHRFFMTARQFYKWPAPCGHAAAAALATV
eukprot:CAMPEP_0175141456 /NCGR_PEP_ID=MMETSP0087-20121206/12139_1 /TAXON_ID=136419 /ORGANISM="Unknown Unknown, Strain D1" /LENGTH=256 /DNA_ID=CAMNT_0016424921 /DNA_START=73 /DNA_END=843 /DNA_ORIENTATION=-